MTAKWERVTSHLRIRFRSVWESSCTTRTFSVPDVSKALHRPKCTDVHGAGTAEFLCGKPHFKCPVKKCEIYRNRRILSFSKLCEKIYYWCACRRRLFCSKITYPGSCHSLATKSVRTPQYIQCIYTPVCAREFRNCLTDVVPRSHPCTQTSRCQPSSTSSVSRRQPVFR